MPKNSEKELVSKLNPDFNSPSKRAKTTDREGPLSLNLPCTFRIARSLGRNFAHNKSLTELRIVGLLISQEGWSNLAEGLSAVKTIRLLLINF